MKATENIGFANVQAVHSGPEGDLWELAHAGKIAQGIFVARKKE